MKTKFKTCLCAKCISELINNSHKITLFLLLVLFGNFGFAQFHGAPGSNYTSAMYKDSTAFVAWAKTCTVTRGWQDAANHSLGTTTVGIDANGTLKAGANSVVSLGDSGIAILTFSNTIRNGFGSDFAVFENGFADNFLELAFVEVSSDGINYVRFPATSNTQFTTQVGSFDPLDCTKLNNLAGKYRADYGTPFDLEDVKNAPGLNVNAITHVKIIDVVGSITPSLASVDMNNNIINDPFPTAFGSGGFDLDAVGVINENPTSVNELLFSNVINVFPNPCDSKLFIHSSVNETLNFTIHDLSGKLLLDGMYDSYVDVNSLKNGIYFIKVSSQKVNITNKLIVTH